MLSPCFIPVNLFSNILIWHLVCNNRHLSCLISIPNKILEHYAEPFSQVDLNSSSVSQEGNICILKPLDVILRLQYSSRLLIFHHNLVALLCTSINSLNILLSSLRPKTCPVSQNTLDVWLFQVASLVSKSILMLQNKANRVTAKV